jgi:hypothetical protein
MSSTQRMIRAALFCAAAAVARRANAQAPCLTTGAVVDSARNDVLSVLRTDNPLIVELRQEQGLALDNITALTVSDRSVCSRLASSFKRTIPAGTRYVVLRVGPMYYVRDPDQRRGTGVLTDSTFRVVMRFGAELSSADRRP